MAKVEFEDQTSTDHEVSSVSRENVRILESAYDPDNTEVFRSGGVLVKIVENPETGNLVKVPLTPALLRVNSAKWVTFYKRPKKEGGNNIPVDLPFDAARAYLDNAEASRHPEVGTISNCPVINPRSGQIKSGRGYSRLTQQFLDAPDIQDAVPAKPTKDQARSAFALIRSWFRTFSFEGSEMVTDSETGDWVVNQNIDPGVHESAFLVGAVFGAIARGSVSVAPAMLVDAPSVSGSGVGKGLAGAVCSVIAHGKKFGAITYGGSAEEFDKRIGGAAASGQPAMILDNFNSRALGGDTLTSLITESPSRIRLLGSSAMVEVNQRMWIYANGTDLKATEDLVRRCIYCLMDAGVEHPSRRKFVFDPLKEAMEHRTALLAAAFTVLRWGIQQGSALKVGLPMGSFETWARLVRDPLVALGCVDPALYASTLAAGDPMREAWTEFYEQWWMAFGDKPITFGIPQKGYTQAHDELFEQVIALVFGPKASLHVPGEAHTRRRVGEALSRRHRQVLGGYRLTKLSRENGKAQAQYQLSWVGEGSPPEVSRPKVAGKAKFA